MLIVEGDLDLASAPTLRHRLRDAAQAAVPARLAVDLDAAGVVDSVGLGLLVGLRRRVVEAGGEMVVVCSNPRLVALLAVTGLDGVFRVVASLDEVAA